MMRLKHLLLFCLLMIGGGSYAYDFEVNGICYNILDATAMTVEVTYPNDSQPNTSSGSKYKGNITIPATVSNDGTEYKVTAIARYAFYGSTITSVTIGNNVETIGNAAFYNCTNLASVKFPNSLKSIERSAFTYCAKLTSIVIPKNVTAIDEVVFSSCSGLTTVTSLSKNPCTVSSNTFLNSFESKRETLNVPYGTTNAYQEAGWTASFITVNEIDVPNVGDTFQDEASGLWFEVFSDDEVEVIKDSSYSNLTCVNIPARVEYKGVAFNVTSIGNSAFTNRTNITELIIPNSITMIHHWAFDGCTNITKVIIPNSVTYLGHYAFKGCTSLTEVVIGDGVTDVVSDEVPDGWREGEEYTILGFGFYAFKKCTSLKTVTIGRNVINICNYAFEDCMNIEEIICRAATPPTFNSNIDTFMSDLRNTCTVYVPQGSLMAYKSSNSSWNTRFSKITDKVSITLNESNGKGYATYCTTADLDFTKVEGVKAYVATKDDVKSDEDGTYIELQSVTNVPAGTGIMLIGTKGTHEIPFVLTGESIENNLLVGTLTETALTPTTEKDGVSYTNYVLGNGNSGVGFYKTKEGSIAAHKAYLQLPSNNVNGVRLVIGDGFETGIGVTTRQESAPQDGAVYNLRGQRVEKPQHGLYIVNGKKVVLK